MHRPRSGWQTAPMLGAVLMVILLVIVMPVGILVGGAVVAWLLGGLLKSDVDSSHEGSELLEVSEANPYNGPA